MQFDEQFAAQHIDRLQRIGSCHDRSFSQASQSTDNIQTTALVLQQHVDFQTEQPGYFRLQTRDILIRRTRKGHQHVNQLLVFGRLAKNVQAVADLRRA